LVPIGPHSAKPFGTTSVLAAKGYIIINKKVCPSYTALLKVDKSFVDGLGSAMEDTTIVRAVVSLAHTLNLNITGEGIQTAAQCRDLQILGYNHDQGYHFAKTQPGDTITTLLAAAPAHHDALRPGCVALLFGAWRAILAAR
jgi:predicted signal transduction protein with EAL and GGDEF domain